MNGTIKNGGPAFPAKVSINRDTGDTQPYQFGNNDFCVGGMTLRDYFAAKAMQGICASGPSFEWTDKRIAEGSYKLADAMLAAREVQS